MASIEFIYLIYDGPVDWLKAEIYSRKFHLPMDVNVTGFQLKISNCEKLM